MLVQKIRVTLNIIIHRKKRKKQIVRLLIHYFKGHILLATPWQKSTHTYVTIVHNTGQLSSGHGKIELHTHTEAPLCMTYRKNRLFKCFVTYLWYVLPGRMYADSAKILPQLRLIHCGHHHRQPGLQEGDACRSQHLRR